MFRKAYFLFIVAACVVALGSIGAVGQTAPISGTVEMDGTHAPVAGAVVEAYRTDVKLAPLTGKTSKKGEFTFAGLLLGADYALAVSGPGISPIVFPNVKAGQDRIVISVAAGDGHKLSADEIRKAATAPKAAGGDPEVSAEEQKARAEMAAKNAEILAKNEKIKGADETARKSNEEGKVALDAGNYDLAIQKYTEGITAVPDYVGSTPILWAGKMNALKMKGRNLYNESTKLTDLDQKKAKSAEASRLFDEALMGFDAAMKVMNGAAAPKDPAEQKSRDNLKLGLYSIAIDVHRLRALTAGAAANTDQVTPLVTEYLALESDPAKKTAVQMTLGDIIRVSEHREQAIAAYRKVLEVAPDNLDAQAYLGLGLVDLAWLKDNDKAMSQEGANYLQKFIAVAPDTHPMKEGAVQYLKILETQNVVPVKQPGRKKS